MSTIYIFYVTLLQAIAIWAGDYERELYRDLLAQYDPLVRPTQNESQPVDVLLSMDLQQVIDIDEKSQIMYANVWLKMNWKDIYLVWDPANYGGVSEVRMPIGRIWKPDILLYNSADTQFDSTWPTNAIVYNTGDIAWIPPGIIKSTCKVDIAHFPFDDQKCPLKFGSWTFSGGQIDLKNGSVGLETYTTNGEWKLMDVISVQNSIKYDCCPDPYYDVTFTIVVRRRTLYFFLNLVVPSALISALTLLGFTLPPESGEKLTLGVTIFMSLCVFLLMVAEAMPQTSEAVPLISTYFSCIMICISCSVVFTVIVINFHHRSSATHTMSPFFRRVFLVWMPRILMMERPSLDDDELDTVCTTDTLMRPTFREDTNGNCNKGLLANVLDMDPSKSAQIRYEISQKHSNKNGSTRSNSNIPNGVVVQHKPSMTALPNDYHLRAMMDILAEIRLMTKKITKNDKDQIFKNDWHYAAMVVDRICLIVFTTFLIVSTLGILFSAPHWSFT